MIRLQQLAAGLMRRAYRHRVGCERRIKIKVAQPLKSSDFLEPQIPLRAFVPGGEHRSDGEAIVEASTMVLHTSQVTITLTVQATLDSKFPTPSTTVSLTKQAIESL